MDLNGISTNNYSTTNKNTTNSTTNKNTSTNTDTNATSANNAENTTAQKAVVYEKSSKNASNYTYSGKKTVANPELVAKLKADADARTSQFKSLVEKLLTKQGKAVTFNDDIWNQIRQGNLSVDAQTAAQAQKDVAEDGYWGVKQTSERILSFAQGLAGSDPDQLEKMRNAFEKGFKSAEKSWGGKLPSISQQTYDAVMKGFDELQGKNQTETASTTA